MNKKNSISPAFVLGLALVCGACGDDEDPSADTSASESATGGETEGGDVVPLTAEEAGPVVENYAALVEANYADALSSANDLRDALAAFVADPSEQTQDAAKEAWLTAREPYGQTESFRFYGGPIDDDDGPEGQLNAWPMDEAYVDYVEGMAESGIINDTSAEISKEGLAALNEVGGEENVATGYHAIEFLLWGQDANADGAGERSFEDYLDGAPNFDRRGQYLGVVADLLIDDLQAMNDAWAPASSGNYRESFVALSPEDAITNIMRGIGALSAAELAEERINVALETKLQEDEHSCFSDNTHNDVLYNFLAIKNVYLGDYGSVSGPGIDTLVEARDPDLAAQITAKLEATESLVRGMPVPFDNAIAKANTEPDAMAIADVVTNLRELGDLFVMAAATMDISLNTALE